MKSLSANLSPKVSSRDERRWVRVMEDTVSELRLKVKERDLRLSQAEHTIEALERSLGAAKKELEQSLAKNRSLEKRLKNYCKQQSAPDSVLTPKFASSMMTSFRKANTDLVYERGEA